MPIQSVLFKKELFTTAKARAYLKKRNLKPIKRVDITENYLRYRIRSPKGFKRFYSKEIQKGVSYIIGVK